MSIIVNNEERIINLQLASQQGPAGASTVAASNAAVAAQQSQLEAAGSASAAAASAVSAMQSQVAAANSAVESENSAIESAASAAESLDYLEFIRDNYVIDKTYTSYQEALSAYGLGLFTVGDVVLIIADERYQNARTLSRAVSFTESIDFDFVGNTYSITEPLEFIDYAGVNLVSPPATSTSEGFFGAFAIDSNFLYIGIGTNSWKRITLETF